MRGLQALTSGMMAAASQGQGLTAFAFQPTVCDSEAEARRKESAEDPDVGWRKRSVYAQPPPPQLVPWPVSKAQKGHAVFSLLYGPQKLVGIAGEAANYLPLGRHDLNHQGQFSSTVRFPSFQGCLAADSLHLHVMDPEGAVPACPVSTLPVGTVLKAMFLPGPVAFQEAVLEPPVQTLGESREEIFPGSGSPVLSRVRREQRMMLASAKNSLYSGKRAHLGQRPLTSQAKWMFRERPRDN
ncbi:hypothetical protein E5288_WYG007470 [Bos mutus]|uniref:Uncharacterized protein n=1 Tax=Bos mutus TaxID=72004 RepID=A0A6B0RA52_9CETA|nr:hypothetical protein [Bos mutus]